MKEYAKKFYKSNKWQKCRSSYINNRIMIDGGMCEECQKNLGYIVHHTIQLTPYNINNSEISLNHNLLKYVCKSCHDKYEGHGLKRKAEKNLSVNFDIDGQPTPPPKKD